MRPIQPPAQLLPAGTLDICDGACVYFHINRPRTGLLRDFPTSSP